MTMAVTETPAIREIRTAEAAGKSDGTFNQLAGVIRSKRDHELLKEKISVRHLDFYYQDGNHALKNVSYQISAIVTR
jgi:phosphate transport system ATP-binding protein